VAGVLGQFMLVYIYLLHFFPQMVANNLSVLNSQVRGTMVRHAEICHMQGGFGSQYLYWHTSHVKSSTFISS